MAITVEAVYENGVLKLSEPLPLEEKQRILLTIQESRPQARAGYGLVSWSGSIEDLDALIEDVENDPVEGA